METSSHRIRILLIEGIRSLTTIVENILFAKPAQRLFETISVPNLKRAIQKINEGSFDLILIELDPEEDPTFSHLARLHEVSHKIPVVALLAGHHQPEALKVLQARSNSI